MALPATDLPPPPTDTAELLVVVDDPDAPGGTFVHWTVWGLAPATTALDGQLPAGAVQGQNDFGRAGYVGPCPPPGDGAHRYRFRVVALDAETKLVVSWLVGKRNTEYAVAFMKDVAARLAHRVQLTTDGHKGYLVAVDDAFGINVDYAMLQKLYGNEGQERQAEVKYSPAEVRGAIKDTIQGFPDPRHISTSYVERQNLTMRMSMRRFTRLTNAFSKKVENLAYAVALHFMFYNFCRIHQTLRVTPAMEAGVTDHVWSLEEIIALLP